MLLTYTLQTTALQSSRSRLVESMLYELQRIQAKLAHLRPEYEKAKAQAQALASLIHSYDPSALIPFHPNLPPITKL